MRFGFNKGLRRMQCQEASNAGPSPQIPSPLKPEIEQKKVVVFLRERKPGTMDHNAVHRIGRNEGRRDEAR